MPAGIVDRDAPVPFQEEANHLRRVITDKTRMTSRVPVAVSPDVTATRSIDTLSDDSSDDGSKSTGSFTSSTNDNTRNISVSEHKLAELEGRFVPEPLLQENSNRFVLFPIQDKEVRLEVYWFCCMRLCYKSHFLFS